MNTKRTTREIETHSDIFDDLRNACVQLSRQSFLPHELFDGNCNTLTDDLETLLSLLAAYHDNALTPVLIDYIFVPIGGLLRQDSVGWVQRDKILQILGHLLRLGWASVGAFEQPLAERLLPVLTFLVTDNADVENAIASRTSSFLSSTTFTLRNFIYALSLQPYGKQFFTLNNQYSLVCLGHLVTILLEILVHSQSSEYLTQLDALETLMLLYRDLIPDGELLSNIIPGNISAFSKVLTKPGLGTNHDVVCKTLSVMAELLCLVYADSDLKILLPERETASPLSLLNDSLQHRKAQSNGNQLTPKIKQSHRSTVWLKATSLQLKNAIGMFIPKLLRRKNDKIDKALTMFITRLIQECPRSLNVTLPITLEALISLGNDPGMLLLQHVTVVHSLVLDKLDKLEVILGLDDFEQLDYLRFALKQLSGNNSILRRTVMCLLDAITATRTITPGMSKFQTRLTTTHSSAIIANELIEIETHIQPPEYDVHQNLKRHMMPKLSHLLRSLKPLFHDASDIEDLISEILAYGVHENDLQTRCLSLWTATQFALGINSSEKDGEPLNYLMLGNENDEVMNTPFGWYNILECSNQLLQQISFMIEGRTMTWQEESMFCSILLSIGTVCRYMSDNFQAELPDILYSVVELLASPSPVVRQAAQYTTYIMADTLYEGSVETLLLENMDYIVDGISTKLNMGMTERVSTVLIVVTRLGGYDTIESFRDVIETVFKLLDHYNGYTEVCLQFFRLFEYIALEIKKRYLQDNMNDKISFKTSQQRSTFTPWGITDIDQVIHILDKEPSKNLEEINNMDIGGPKNFEEYLDSNLKEEDSDDEDASDGSEKINFESSQMNNEVSWVSPIPKEPYLLLLKIIGYSDRLLLHNSKLLQVQILRVLRMVVPMVATQPESLLPQIASIWPRVAKCSLLNDYSIVEEACRTLTEMIKWGGDFVGKRFIDLWKDWQSNSTLLHEIQRKIIAYTIPAGKKVVSTKYRSAKFPPVTLNALEALCDALLNGIKFTEMLLPDTMLQEMLSICIYILPKSRLEESSSLHIGDVLYNLI